jgi:hypothetical protein
MIIFGACAAIAGFLAAHTTLLLAYKAGNLATVHAMCSSGIGEFAQGLNAGRGEQLPADRQLLHAVAGSTVGRHRRSRRGLRGPDLAHERGTQPGPLAAR